MTTKANQKEQPSVAPEASGPAALVERIENKLFVAGQMDAQGHAAEKFHVGRGGPVLALSRRLLDEARADMQTLASASPAPACASCAEKDREIADLDETLSAVSREHVAEMTRARQAEASLQAQARENAELRAFIERRGYRRCDIPACNCDSFHGGHAEMRLGEIRDALDDAGVDTNGRTTLEAMRAALKGQ